MTKAVSFTQASLQRAIKAARKAGLHVTGIRADGTVIVTEVDNPGDDIVHLAPDGHAAAPSKWEDVGA